MSKVSENQRIEWTENPVTIELLKLIDVKLIDLVSQPTANCLVYGEPDKTHENIVQQDKETHMLAMFRFALEGDWDYFMEIEDEK